MSKPLSPQNTVIQATEDWLNNVVIGLNLCPFAAKPAKQKQIHFSVSRASSDVALIEDLETELNRLIEHSDNTQPDYIETSLVILENSLSDFDDYNQFLNMTDDILHHHQLEGVFQVASFHPHYQFAGTHPNDRENLTNCSPYPVFHLIREDSLEAALQSYPNPELIPERNIETLAKLTEAQIAELFPYLTL